MLGASSTAYTSRRAAASTQDRYTLTSTSFPSSTAAEKPTSTAGHSQSIGSSAKTLAGSARASPTPRPIEATPTFFTLLDSKHRAEVAIFEALYDLTRNLTTSTPTGSWCYPNHRLSHFTHQPVPAMSDSSCPAVASSPQSEPPDSSTVVSLKLLPSMTYTLECENPIGEGLAPS